MNTIDNIISSFEHTASAEELLLKLNVLFPDKKGKLTTEDFNMLVDTCDDPFMKFEYNEQLPDVLRELVVSTSSADDAISKKCFYIDWYLAQVSKRKPSLDESKYTKFEVLEHYKSHNLRDSSPYYGLSEQQLKINALMLAVADKLVSFYGDLPTLRDFKQSFNVRERQKEALDV